MTSSALAAHAATRFLTEKQEQQVQIGSGKLVILSMVPAPSAAAIGFETGAAQDRWLGTLQCALDAAFASTTGRRMLACEEASQASQGCAQEGNQLLRAATAALFALKGGMLHMPTNSDGSRSTVRVSVLSRDEHFVFCGGGDAQAAAGELIGSLLAPSGRLLLVDHDRLMGSLSSIIGGHGRPERLLQEAVAAERALVLNTPPFPMSLYEAPQCGHSGWRCENRPAVSNFDGLGHVGGVLSDRPLTWSDGASRVHPIAEPGGCTLPEAPTAPTSGMQTPVTPKELLRQLMDLATSHASRLGRVECLKVVHLNAAVTLASAAVLLAANEGTQEAAALEEEDVRKYMDFVVLSDLYRAMRSEEARRPAAQWSRPLQALRAYMHLPTILGHSGDVQQLDARRAAHDALTEVAWPLIEDAFRAARARHAAGVAAV